MASPFDWFTKKNVTVGSENIPTAFKHISSGAPSSVYLSMVTDGITFDEAMQDTNSMPMNLDDIDMFNTPEMDDPDAVEKAIYQLSVAENTGVNPEDIFETPYGPSLTSIAIDALLDEYPALDAGLDLHAINESFEMAENMLDKVDPSIQAAMDAAQDKAEEEGTIEETGSIWKQLGVNLGNAGQSVLDRGQDILEGTILPKAAYASEGEKPFTPWQEDMFATEVAETANASTNVFSAFQDPEAKTALTNVGDSALLGQGNQPDPTIGDVDPSIQSEFDEFGLTIGGGPRPMPTLTDLWLEHKREESTDGLSFLERQNLKALLNYYDKPGSAWNPDTPRRNFGPESRFWNWWEAQGSPSYMEEPEEYPQKEGWFEKSMAGKMIEGIDWGLGSGLAKPSFGKGEQWFSTLNKIILEPEPDGSYMTPEEIIEYLNELGQFQGEEGAAVIRQWLDLNVWGGESARIASKQYGDLLQYSPFGNPYPGDYSTEDVLRLQRLLESYADQEETGAGLRGREITEMEEQATTNAQRILEYRTTNPNTPMNDAQIIAFLENQDIGNELGFSGTPEEQREQLVAMMPSAAKWSDANKDKEIQKRIQDKKLSDIEEEVRAAMPTDTSEEDIKTEVDRRAAIPSPTGTTTDTTGTTTTTGVPPATTTTDAGDIMDPGVEDKPPGQMTPAGVVTENLRSTFYRTVYAYPESNRTDVQRQLPYIFNDTKLLFFLWGGIDAYGPRRDALESLDEAAQTEAIDRLSNNYRTFVEEYLRDPASKRSGQGFWDRMNIVATTLQKALDTPKEQWDQTFFETYSWVSAAFGYDSAEGERNRSDLLKIAASKGGRGYYSSRIHGAVDRSIAYYKQLGWTPERIFNRMAYLTGLADDPSGETEVEKNPDIPAMPTTVAGMDEVADFPGTQMGLPTQVTPTQVTPTQVVPTPIGQTVDPMMTGMPEDLLLDDWIYDSQRGIVPSPDPFPMPEDMLLPGAQNELDKMLDAKQRDEELFELDRYYS